MGRSGKKGIAKPLLPYLSGNPDSREISFVQVGDSFLKDARFQELKPGPRFLFLCMANEARGGWKVAFSGKTAEGYGLARSTYDGHIRELIEKGFIEEVDDGEHLQYWKRKYRFSMDWKRRPMPDNKRRTSVSRPRNPGKKT